MSDLFLLVAEVLKDKAAIDAKEEIEKLRKENEQLKMQLEHSRGQNAQLLREGSISGLVARHFLVSEMSESNLNFITRRLQEALNAELLLILREDYEGVFTWPTR
jgi:hypothetical protein